MKIKIGCDPEVALRNPNSGQFVSAEGVVPGDKKNPYKVKKGTIQTDGFAAEIGIDPAESPEEFADNVETVMEELKKYIGGYEIVMTDHVIFDKDVYLAQSDAGRELGCEPDFSAYLGVANSPPVPNPMSLRTFSGHIHIGWCDDADLADPGHFADCRAVSKQMDCFLGVPSLLWGNNSVRRKLYGKAGAFRFKSYGCEYRTLDNAWLQNRERMIFVAKNALEGMTRLYQGQHVYNDMGPQMYIDSTKYTRAHYLSTLNRNMIDCLDDVKVDTIEKPEVKKRIRKPKVIIDEAIAAQPRNMRNALDVNGDAMNILNDMAAGGIRNVG